MEKTKAVWKLNLAAAVLFLLLLAVHLAIGKWGGYGSMLTVGDVFFIQPVLGFCTGYALLFGLFYLLRARIDMVETGRFHLLRIIRLLITVLMVSAVLFMGLELFGYLIEVRFVSLTPKLYLFLLEFCQTRWIWALLGVYWFVRLNINRVAELPEDDEDE